MHNSGTNFDYKKMLKDKARAYLMIFKLVLKMNSCYGFECGQFKKIDGILKITIFLFCHISTAAACHIS